MNSVNLVGRLAADPELRHTNNGTAVVNFIMAVRRNRKDPTTGQYEADFIRCQAWRGIAEVIANNFGTGRMIGVSGSWRTGTFEGQDGKRVYTNDCVVENITFVDPNKSDSSAPDNSQGSGNTNTFGGSQNVSGGQGTHNNDPFANSGQTIDIDDDSLPF
ncbi:ssDNA binding protein [Bacillus phage 049ML001]|uniref:SsDNA binding protein n=1 Tax=Bacillus phage 049ML001 TaxID=2601660 RepID=A0A5P8PI29_9CAUD|nr:ssDNA binding protein [Bacillus phage 049ML001]QFR56353.1 ssDNA binding protein [Bacillus phage 049ML001]QFR56433.1 ssDNA binding protein [Bacillus phage 049ML003]